MAFDRIFPVGTHVVTQIDIRDKSGEILFAQGAVGRVVKAPLDKRHHYRVRLVDGSEVTLRHHELTLRKHDRNPPAAAPENSDLYPYVIYRCIVGSRAYGLDEADSDTDWRGIYLPPAHLHWSLYGVPEQLENEARQETYWELQKFILLALKANPNILECLYTPLVDLATPLAEELLAMREAFLSRLIYQTYNGYVMSQFKKLEHHRQNHGTIKWKHAMHLIRLLLTGVSALQEGTIPVRVVGHRERLLAIRRGEVAWDEVDTWRLELHQQFDAAFRATTLPERPDYERANAFLVKARRSAVHD